MIMTWILPLTLSFLGGGILAWLLSNYFGALEKKRAQSEAREIIDRAKDASELLEMDQKELLLELEEEIWTKVEPELFKLEEHLEELEEKLEEHKEKMASEAKDLKLAIEPKQADINAADKKLKEFEQRLQNQKSEQGKLLNNWIDQLAKKMNSSRDQFIKELMQGMVSETQIRCLKDSADYLTEVSHTVEQRAKRVLAIAIDRFARPYCPERGLGIVDFPDAHVRQLFLDKDRKTIGLIQEICGCDILIEEDSESIAIAGFDPVRREWTRRSLEKILKERKSIHPELIRRKTADAKRELVKQIRQDGDNVCRELGVRDIHQEIRQMMGSLRYRYSFTQNQHFHCAEVGWLCGLLAGELKLPIRLARRAGMLHDIGKSMDHAMEGGHAVIGADFIKLRNEAPEIVHAVRAHHFDEQPNSDLAFLVIAADAISGARPGARRSALESYTQKVTELEGIARSFPGVDDCYVLSGGREVRVIANEELLDDVKALALSKELAARIENEVSYPGQIKVVVVRNTYVQETTRV
jgi:ribonuclease Y